MAGYDERTQPGASDPGIGDELVDDPGATVAQEAVTPPQGSDVAPPRRTTKSTLASIAIPRPRPADDASVPPADLSDSDELGAAIPNEMDEEWAVSDQPTVLIAPRNMPARHAPRSRPAYLETDQYAAWPPATTPRDGSPPVKRDQSAPSAPVSREARRPDVIGGPRLASPSGRLMPHTPPEGVPRATLPDPRMERFQELRHTRTAHEHGSRAPDDPSQVAEVVRQWWADLLPGLRSGLSYQREARASGTYPLPATAPTTTSRLGDAFGRLAASAREVAGRAHAAAAPHLRRLHDQAEQAAQALIDRIEGSPVRQQAPFLGPGRIAVLFRPGVTVGQAQRLLMTAQARPLRLIPRKHGFLALVRPGTEEEIAERLRQHPYVRDVIYIEYDETEDLEQDDLPEDELPEDELPEDELPEDELPEDELPEDELPEDELPEDELPYDELSENELLEGETGASRPGRPAEE
jgi:hypothetical protein